MKTGLRRSALYVPGDSEKMLQKATEISSDMLLLNLEDGVAASRKDAARENIANALRTIDYGEREVVVRINGLHSSIGEKDLMVIALCRPDGICLPKVEGSSDIMQAEKILLEVERSHGMLEGSIGIHAMIESASGVLRAAEIAASSPRMASMIFGSADYVADLHCQPGPDRAELLLALQMIVTAARASAIDAIDAPCFDIHNADLLEKESCQARRLGYSGKSVLHPNQLPIINRVFDVTPEEIAWAERVIFELDAAENRGKALTTYDGQLLDNPHRAAAERILSRKLS